MSQSIKKGSSAKQGTVITVTVSSGDKKVEVPYVAYMSESEAKQTLQAYNLKYSVSYEHSETVSSGLVISQTPGSGKNVKPGSKVKLVVSKGRTKVSVPNVSGMNSSSAADTLVNHNLRYTITYSHSESVGWGKVISAAPGGKQEKGTKVTLNVSCGTAGKLVSASTYENSYSDGSKYSASPRYRYSTRQKEYTTSGSSSLSGWNRTGGKEILSQTGSLWNASNKNGRMSPTNYGTYGMEKTVNSKTCYEYQAYHCRCNSYFPINYKDSNPGSYHAKGCNGTAPIKLYVRAEKPISQRKVGTTYIQSGKENSVLGLIYYIEDNGTKVSSFKANGSSIYLDKIRDKYWVYKITETKYCYHYWRWGSWSGWSDWTTKRTTGDTVRESSDRAYYVVGRQPN